MSARNVSLTEHLASFVDQQVAAGRHQSASEVVREALRRYEEEIALSTMLQSIADAGWAACRRRGHVRPRSGNGRCAPRAVDRRGGGAGHDAARRSLIVRSYRLAGPARRAIVGILRQSALSFGPSGPRAIRRPLLAGDERCCCGPEAARRRRGRGAARNARPLPSQACEAARHRSGAQGRLTTASHRLLRRRRWCRHYSRRHPRPNAARTGSEPHHPHAGRRCAMTTGLGLPAGTPRGTVAVVVRRDFPRIAGGEGDGRQVICRRRGCGWLGQWPASAGSPLMKCRPRHLHHPAGRPGWCRSPVAAPVIIELQPEADRCCRATAQVKATARG